MFLPLAQAELCTVMEMKEHMHGSLITAPTLYVNTVCALLDSALILNNQNIFDRPEAKFIIFMPRK